MSGHVYTVEFRIYGKNVLPKKISSELSLQPCQERLAGDKLGSKVFDEGMWAYNGGEIDESIEWDSLESGLRALLDKILSKKSILEKYKQEKYNLIWWCGHFQSSFDGGPSLSPTLLKDLGDLGVEVFIDCYFSKDDDE